MQRSLVAGVYEKTVDRDSAHEILKARREAIAAATPQPATTPTAGGSVLDNVLGGVLGGGNSRRQSAGDAMVKSAARAIGSEVGRRVIRGVLGSIFGGGGRR
jgi:hypothetical protein